MFVPRVPADYGHVVIAEIQGREPRGTVERMIAAATGLKPAADDISVSAGALLKLADALQSPNLIRKQINELASAAAASKAAAESVKTEQQKLDRARQDLDAERAAQAAVIARELKDHQTAMVAANAELASVKKLAADLKSKAEGDAAAAAKIRAEVEKRYRAFAA
jgi:hypothetical protein